MRTPNKPRLSKLRDDEVATPAYEMVLEKAAGVAGLLQVKLPAPNQARFRSECAALLEWARTGENANGHTPKTFLKLLLDVLYDGKVPDASLNTVDKESPLRLVLAAGMGRMHLEAREPVPTVQLAALGNIDRGHLSHLIRLGELRRTQAAIKSGRAIDAPILPSDARKWLGWDKLPESIAPVEPKAAPEKKKRTA